jgi:eukaryotic-like serine/threonine-protein kinase
MNAKNNPQPETVEPPGPGGAFSPELDDPRVVVALEEYLAALEAGQKPNRQAFLARHADVAEALAECLDGMEVLHVAGSSPQQPSQEAGTASTSVEWQPGTLLGEYRIIREIGRGGMGVVYEAEQLSLGRRIALKVLPFAWSLDPRQLRRFKNEARAAAQLHHQNIVPVYAVGCERGVHFFAMQYIEGQTLAEVIREVRRLAGREDRGSKAEDPKPEAEKHDSTMEERRHASDTCPRLARSSIFDPRSSFFRTAAQLGVQAAEALEHAHELGVVHRDVKPGNLLVDMRGQLWVSDFGLAQFQCDAALTLTGDLLGTLRYLSPEQALAKRGVVDHRTDVYSLGVTLYELLTGEPAYNGQDREEVLRQIAWEEPPAPRRLSRSIPADLETIVLKAMAKQVEERYNTARELADDLRRFLEEKPILARRPTLLERAAKWSRRHWAVVTSAVGMLVLLSVGFAASTVLIAREQANTKAAYQRLTEEQARTKDAYEAEVRNFQQARRMLDFFAQVSAEDLADKPQVQEVRRKLLQAALDYYQAFIEQCPDDPSTRKELVRSHLRVANLLNEMGAPAEALAALQEAHRILEKKPDAELQRLSSALRLNWLRNGGPLLLLEQPSVQEELQFSPDQARQVARLASRRRAAFWDSPNLSLERWRSKFEELAAQEKAVLEGLRTEQARRLKQIAWQEGGASAFSDPELLEALRLTEEQKESIRAIQDEARRTNWVGPRPGGPQPEDWKKAADSWKKSRDQVLAVLTADQETRWKELTGEPFKGEIRTLFPSSFGLRPNPWVPRKP